MEWTKEERGQALSAFYYGYLWTQIPGGIAVRFVGPKYVIVFVVLASAILNFLSSPAAHRSYGLFVACRVVLGLVQGPCFSAMQQMLVSWTPPLERSILVGIVYTGKSVVDRTMSPILWDCRISARSCAYHVDFGSTLRLGLMGLGLLLLRRCFLHLASRLGRLRG